MCLLFVGNTKLKYETRSGPGEDGGSFNCISRIEIGNYFLAIIEDGDNITDDVYSHFLISISLNDTSILFKNLFNLSKTDSIIISKLAIGIFEIYDPMLFRLKKVLPLSDEVQTVQYVVEAESDTYNNYFFNIDSNGNLTEALCFSCYSPIHFYKKSDTLYVSRYTSRDNLVSHFQDDYLLEYDLKLKKIKEIIPDPQNLNFRTIALKRLNVYRTIETAQSRNKKDIIFVINPDTKIFLGYAYWDKNVVEVKINSDSSGYLNNSDVKNRGVRINFGG